MQDIDPNDEKQSDLIVQRLKAPKPKWNIEGCDFIIKFTINIIELDKWAQDQNDVT